MAVLRIYYPDGTFFVARSEREARREARRLLGCRAVVEYPTETGWSYGDRASRHDDDPLVRVEVR